jgi:serine protease Do
MTDDYERKDTPVFPDEREQLPPEPRRQEYEAAPDITPEPVPSDNIDKEAAQAEEAPAQPEETPAQPEATEIPAPQPEQPQQEQPQPQTPLPYTDYRGAGANSQPYGSFSQNNPYGAGPAQDYGAQGQPYSAYPQYNRPAGGVPPYSPYGNRQYQPYGTQYGGHVPPQPPEKKGNKGLKVFFSVLAAAVIIGVVFIFVAYFGNNDNGIGKDTTSAAETTSGAPVIETQSSPSSSSDLPGGFTAPLTSVQIAAKVKPWVVGIVVYSNSSGSASSEGSGILWKEDGNGYTYIITCAHVISGSGLSYTVQTENGEQYDAERVGYDSKTDLGILKIKKTGLPLAEFGDSGALRVGDPVYAVGNPGGTEFFGSFTSGVVSAIDRSVKSTYTMVCIQHDAAINPGNSGGALVNSYGQVIGINSLKIINTQYEGMGFAIPIKSAQPVINSLAQHGYVPNRPKLGITYAEAIDYQQYSMIVKIKGLPSGSLIITDIGEESDLKNTDARQYDMITAVDGKDLTKPDVLIDKIENSKVGDTLKLTLCRIDNNYKITQFDVSVKLVEDKGNSEKETTTTINPFDFFNGLY